MELNWEKISLNYRNIGTKLSNEGKESVAYWKISFKHTVTLYSAIMSISR